MAGLLAVNAWTFCLAGSRKELAMNATEPRSPFQEVQFIMAAPMTDDEIEALMNQEPLNQGLQLPANEEPTNADNC